MNELFIDLLVQIIFGWPATITSILLSIVGVWLKKPVLLVVAGIIAIPFTWYISGGFRSPALILPLLQFGSAYAITRQKIMIALLLLGPMIILATMLAYFVATQPLGR